MDLRICRLLLAVSLGALLCSAVVRASPIGPPRPLLLVPGLMGSILQKHTFESDRVEQIFPLSLEQTRHIPELYCGCRLYEDDSGFTSDEDDDHHCHSPSPDDFEVIVPDDNFGLYAIDFLMPNELLEANRKPYYHDMIVMLTEEHGYEAGVTLFGFPYDWRQPTSHVALHLQERINEILQATGAEQLDIISHSMGCLVTQAYFALPIENKELSLSYDHHPQVHTHIAAGGPYGGIGGGWTVLTLWGFQYDQVMIMPWNLHQLLIQFPSTYDFIARSITFIDEWDSSSETYRGEPVPTFSFERDGETVTIAAGDGECLSIVRLALSDNTVTINDGNPKACPAPFRDDLLDLAMSTIQDIEANITPPQVFHQIYGVVGDSGWSVHFPRDVTSENDYSQLLGIPTSFIGAPPFIFDLTACVRGDGVVPQISTTQSHMQAASTSYFQVQHNRLVIADLDSYEHLLGLSCPWSGFWRLEMLNVTGVEFVSGDGVGVVDFCPDREPSDGEWICEGELCGHYDAQADAATVLLKLQQNGWRVDSRQDELSRIDASTIKRVEGRVWTDHLIATVELNSGERIQLNAYQSDDCDQLSGWYVYDWDPTSQFLFEGTRVQSVAGQCRNGETRDCTAPHMAGQEECNDGLWEPCSVCEAGYRFVDGFPYDRSYCESVGGTPTPVPSATPTTEASVSPQSPSPTVTSSAAEHNTTDVESSPSGEGKGSFGNVAWGLALALLFGIAVGGGVYAGLMYRKKRQARLLAESVADDTGEELQDISVDDPEPV